MWVTIIEYLDFPRSGNKLLYCSQTLEEGILKAYLNYRPSAELSCAFFRMDKLPVDLVRHDWINPYDLDLVKKTKGYRRVWNKDKIDSLRAGAKIADSIIENAFKRRREIIERDDEEEDWG